MKCWNIVADLICTCITVSTRVHRPWLQSILNISVLIQYAQKFRYAKFRGDHSQKRKLKKKLSYGHSSNLYNQLTYFCMLLSSFNNHILNLSGMFLLTCKSYINKIKGNLTLFLFVNVNQMSSLRIPKMKRTSIRRSLEPCVLLKSINLTAHILTRKTSRLASPIETAP